MESIPRAGTILAAFTNPKGGYVGVAFPPGLISTPPMDFGGPGARVLCRVVLCCGVLRCTGCCCVVPSLPLVLVLSLSSPVSCVCLSSFCGPCAVRVCCLLFLRRAPLCACCVSMPCVGCAALACCFCFGRFSVCLSVCAASCAVLASRRPVFRSVPLRSFLRRLRRDTAARNFLPSLPLSYDSGRVGCGRVGGGDS